MRPLFALLLLAACAGAEPTPSAAAPAAAPAAPADAAAPAAAAAPAEKQAAKPVVDEVCAGGEDLFRCTAKGGKQIRLCGADGEERWAMYRFGRADAAPELVFPNTSRAASFASFEYLQRDHVSSQAQILRFSNEGYTYELMEVIGSGEENNYAGVAVSQGEKQVAMVRCEGEVTANWDKIMSITDTLSP